MAKRWTEADDRFIIAYFDSVGPFIGPHDLNRTVESVISRAKHLKKTGAWAAYNKADSALFTARMLAGTKR